MSEGTGTPERPPVSSFRDYRAYLRAMVTYLKATRPWFSYRAFSRRAGYSSPSFLKQVADGKRNLSPSSIARFARALELDPGEHELFEALVLFGQAKTDADRNHHVRRLLRAAPAASPARVEADQYDLFSRWYVPIIRELAGLPGFSDDPGWIGRRLWPRVRAAYVERSLALLERLRMLVRDEAGRLVQSTPHLATGGTVRSLAIRNFHRLMLELAGRSLDLAVERRNVTSLSVPLTRAQYEEACTRIAALRRDLLALSSEAHDEDEAQEIHQIVFALFPVTSEGRQRQKS